MPKIKWLLIALLLPIVALAETVPEYTPQQWFCGCDCARYVALQKQGCTNEHIADWAREAALSTYSYGFGNIHAALQRAMIYFAPNAWDHFRLALLASQNLAWVATHRALLVPQATERPRVQPLALQGGRQFWRVHVPLTLHIQTAHANHQVDYIVNMLVMQMHPERDLQGLKIVDYRVTELS